MVLDVVEESSGRFLVWGTDARGASALLCMADFEPYFYIAGPRDQVAHDAFVWAPVLPSGELLGGYALCAPSHQLCMKKTAAILRLQARHACLL